MRAKLGFLLMALVCPAGFAQSASDRSAHTYENFVGGSIPSGKTITWKFTAPEGSYMAFARVNTQLMVFNRIGTARDGMTGDARVGCVMSGSGRGGHFDEASAYVGYEPAKEGPEEEAAAFGSGFDNESFSLAAPVVSKPGEPLELTLNCSNVSIEGSQSTVLVDRLLVTLSPVASIETLTLVSGKMADAAGSAKPLLPEKTTIRPIGD